MMDQKRRDWYEEQRTMKKINRRIRFNSWRHRAKRKVLFPFRKLMKPRRIVWAEGYHGSYPACPRCGEYVYYKDLCCFCGQRLEDATTVGAVMESHGR